MQATAHLAAARQRGISLIEGVLYLVIALAVIVGGIVFFQQAQLSNQVTDTARAAVGVSSQARALYQNQRDFGDEEITGALLASGAVPSNFEGEDGIVHPFGGEITVTGTGDSFYMELTGLSEAACLRLGSAGDGGQGPMGTGILGVEVGSDNAAAPVTSSDLSGWCNDDATMRVHYGRGGSGGTFTPVGAGAGGGGGEDDGGGSVSP